MSILEIFYDLFGVSHVKGYSSRKWLFLGKSYLADTKNDKILHPLTEIYFFVMRKNKNVRTFYCENSKLEHGLLLIAKNWKENLIPFHDIFTKIVSPSEYVIEYMKSFGFQYNQTIALNFITAKNIKDFKYYYPLIWTKEQKKSNNVQDNVIKVNF